MMGFLAPWFVVAGLAAVGLPILFHMLRRTPRGRMPFSAVMFLVPSPPRLTRRSRIENWPLLLLRGLILLLLALAFGRPFLRQWLERTPEAPRGERVVVLLDNSASMRRGDLWQRAVGEVQKAVDRAGPNDELAIIAFAKQARPVVSFELWRETPVGERAGLVRSALAELQPSWSATWLDDALLNTVDAIEVAGRGDTKADAARSQRVVLISDMQSGSRTTGLQDIEWPKNVMVQVVSLPIKTSNAAIHGLETNEDPPSGDKEHRIRVMLTNAADSSRESFALAWTSEPLKQKTSDGDRAASDYYVPPGQTRVVRAPPLASRDVTELTLSGDDEPFDNRYWFIVPHRQRLRVLHLASEAADDQRSLRFFLERALGQTAVDRVIDVESVDPQAEGTRVLTEQGLADVPLVVMASQRELAKPWSEALNAWIDRGGLALAVLTHADDAGWRALLPTELATGKGITVSEAKAAREYALLSEFDRQHPLFAPFADPRYSDFTKIRFWHHRQLSFDETAAKSVRVLARFDSGDPAVVEFPHRAGRVIVMTAGWHPQDSQLGVSSKFVPLLSTLVEMGWQKSPTATTHETDATIDLRTTAQDSRGPWKVRTPTGREVSVAADAPEFALTDGPGVYTVQSSGETHRLAVNLPAEESKTSPFDPEALAALGVEMFKDQSLPSAETVALRQTMQVRELESRQQGWRWLLLAALGVVLIETVYAGRIATLQGVAS
jgi:hypothetical protein